MTTTQTFPSSTEREIVRARLAAEIEAAQQMGAPDEALERMVRTAADVFHRPYPQYVGHFDAYVVVRVTRNVRTKMGQAFKKGDLTIGAPRQGDAYGDSCWTLYSWRNGIDTAVPVTYAREAVAA